jgi:predicted nucleotidyltransferase
MRLTAEQIAYIKSAAHAVLGDGARVTLFGSRVDDAKKGGDIDLLFETNHPVANPASTIGQIYVALIRSLGDRKIDILLQDPLTAASPVFDIAKKTGVQL